MSDQCYYWDFESEQQLGQWDITAQTGGLATLECRIENDGGNYIFLLPCRARGGREEQELHSIAVNGERFLPQESAGPYYVHRFFPRWGFDIVLRKGLNLLNVTLRCPDGIPPLSELFFSLIPAPGNVKKLSFRNRFHVVEKEVFPAGNDRTDLSSWTPGAGRDISPGRFGFSKGDGLLDCAMPALGIVDKMFLCGQPRYRKPFRWNYSLLPPGMPLHGSYQPRDTGIENDRIDVNHLSVKWSAEFEGKCFSCTYSLATPAILTESEFGFMRISNLRFAGNYHYMLIPRSQGIEEISIDNAVLSEMAENWLLFFGTGKFPDIPLMVVFDRKPDSFDVKRSGDGQLQELIFGGSSLMLTATPFGIECFDAGKTGRSDWVADAVKRCRFWSRAFLAYPVRCTDYFKLDEKTEQVFIRQKFEYRRIRDEWGTEPLELAPLPPPVTLCGTAETSGSFDFRFPTKYGHLTGQTGNISGYSLPFMPPERKFPLVGKDSEIPELLRKNMEKYKSFTMKFSLNNISYPFAGAHLEPFAYASSMLFFMKPEDRDFLRKNILERLAAALEENRTSSYPVIDHGFMMKTMPEYDEILKLYSDPAMRHKKLWNWYDRIEPFTGFKFKICYLNLCYLYNGSIKEGTPEEIRNLKIPLIENDWGVGLTFYYLYLSALAAGSFEEIRRNWKLLKSVYSFFDKMHDWVCMATGFSDNAITWVEGANYGLFTAFIQMAEAAGDMESRDFGIYNAAKQLALRIAIIRSSSNYFPRYFDVEPWYCVKAFHEENISGHGFQNVPKLSGGRIRHDALYNLTTEGLYPETFAALRRFGGPEFRETMSRMRSALLAGTEGNDSFWGRMQQYSSVLIDEALNPDCPAEQVLADMEAGLRKGIVMRQWRGIHIYSRVLPENYFQCQLLAWLEMRRHKLWLEHWEEMRIDRAAWEEECAVIEFSGNGTMRLLCGITEQPSAILLNDCPLAFRTLRKNRIELRPGSAGVIMIEFNKRSS